MTGGTRKAPPRGTRSGVPAPLSLDAEVQFLKGAGPHLASRLRALDITQVQHLLFHLPFRYEDRRHFAALHGLVDGAEALLRVRVDRAEVRYTGRRQLIVTAHDGDDWLRIRFFHFGDAQTRSFASGRWLRAYGVVRFGQGGAEMIHPEYTLADSEDELRAEAQLTPIYSLTTGVTQARLRSLIAQALDIASRDAAFAESLPDLPQPVTLDALRAIHRPASDVDAAQLLAGTHPAQLRLIDEELLAHQLVMRVLRRQVRSRPAPVIRSRIDGMPALQAQLGFVPTGAQTRVIAEVAADLSQTRPMLRLVQGDVGSGKTVVAAAAMLAAKQAGWQSVLMAPTELLAEQHARNLAQWLSPLGVHIALLKSGLKKSARDATLGAIAGGDANVIIGTHAVFQASVQFSRLALVVVDEQHRFGVGQRLSLRDKGPDGLSPHQLVMTATPIPRTLAQTVYADLDVSVIDELPPGRTPVLTVVLGNTRRHEVMERLRAACRQSRQAYWVCTLIEESDEVEAQAAEAVARQLTEELPDVRVGLVHGRMKSADKDAQMNAFKAGEIQLLVATTVIEVGVDVPNASIMVIENAERLGLAQLHQLRGRVGRGSRESQCVLMYQPPLSETARARLETMRSTTDGFEIAQRDLELRGPGEILGRRQTGLIGLKVADPVRDAERIPALQVWADRWLERHPRLASRLIERWVGDIKRYGQV